jgi:DeoR family fructose operon transcriptional repressor
MIKEQRTRKIVELLGTEEIMTVSDIADVLECSPITVRRDLGALEKKGIVNKFHGGAALAKNWTIEPSFHERVDRASDAKQRIGKAAAALIHPDDVVFFDAGTTTLAAANNLPNDLLCTCITTGIQTASMLCRKLNASLILVGGSVHHNSLSSTGGETIAQIRELNADLAFLSTRRFCYPQGTFEPYLPLVEVKKAMAEMSKKVVVLADHTKFGVESLRLTIPVKEIDIFITDDSTSQHYLDEIKEAGIELIVV